VSSPAAGTSVAAEKDVAVPVFHQASAPKETRSSAGTQVPTLPRF